MTAQVIWINHTYRPDDENMRSLENLQTVLHLSLNELAYQYRTETEDQYLMAKYRYHHGFRSRLKLIHSPEIKLESDLKAL